MNLRVAENSRENCEILAPKKVKTVTFINFENKNVAEPELDLRVAENSREIRDEVLVILRVAENNREIPEKVTFLKQNENKNLDDSSRGENVENETGERP